MEAGIAAPIIGIIADKIGPRKVTFIGVFVTGLGVILLSRVDSLVMFYLAFIMISIGLSGCAGHVQMIAVANWFRKNAGKAIGLLSMGIGAGGLLVPMVVWLIAQYNWQTTLVILGVGMWIVCLPLSLVVRHKPEQYGYLPDGETVLPMPENQVTKVDRIRPGQPDVEYTARKALKTQAFWLLMLAAGIGWMGLSAMLVHIMPCLESVGISRGTAGLVVTSLAVFNIISRFGFGWLGDRFDKGKLLAITLALEATGLLIFAYARTVLGLIPFLLTFGPSWGGQGVLLFTIQREYFGRSAYGSIRGLLITGSVVTSIAVPPIVGWVFDVRGSYLLAWLVLSVISAITVPFILNIKPPVKELAKTESC